MHSIHLRSPYQGNKIVRLYIFSFHSECHNLNAVFILFSAEIAKDLPDDSYGLIFGINTFFAYFLQAILTAVVASDLFGFKWNIFQQMNIYGGFLAFVGCSYFLLMLIDGIQTIRRGTTKKIDLNGNSDSNIGNIVL